MPGAQGDVDIAEPTWVAPGDGVRLDADAVDGAAGVRGRGIADFLHEQREPGGIRESFGDAEPIGRSKVVEAPKVADGALPDAACRSAEGLGEGVVGVGLTVAALENFVAQL